MRILCQNCSPLGHSYKTLGRGWPHRSGLKIIPAAFYGRLGPFCPESWRGREQMALGLHLHACAERELCNIVNREATSSVDANSSKKLGVASFASSG